jgi:RNA polymerase sigma factor (sigma-70 family)
MSQTMDSSSLSQDGLFARARAGDQAAWEELFRTCYPKVVRVVRRKLYPPMRSLYDSADFASDVWKSLAAKCERFDFPSIDSLMAFLKQAAEQKVIDALRQRRTDKRDMTRERRIDASDRHGLDAGQLASGGPTPSQVAQADDVRELLRARLTQEECDVLQMRDEGYTNEEISQRTGWHLRKVQRFLKNLHESWRTSGGSA